MKKLLLILTVLACGIGQVRADYYVFFNQDANWYQLCSLTDDDGDGVYSAIVNLETANKLNWENCEIVLSKANTLGENWVNALWANLESMTSIISQSSFTLSESYSTDHKLCIPIKSETVDTYAIELKYNPTTHNFSGSRMIEFASSNDNWHTSNPVYLEETGHSTGIFTGTLQLPESTEFKFISNNNGGAGWYGNDNGSLATSGSNMNISSDGVYEITANFSTNKYNAPSLVMVSAAVGTSGYATFSSNYALDFTGIEAVKAYRAEIDGSVVRLTRVEGKVPASTGLVVAGTTTDIPTTISTTPIGSNLLKPGTGAGVVSEAGFDRYVLAKNRTTGDIHFAKLISTPREVPVGMAYLEVASGGAPSLSIVFDGEDDMTTGINASLNDKAEMINDNAIYNLAGQRVSKPTKGLYIVNGKKVVIK